jgi:hypothetical protein
VMRHACRALRHMTRAINNVDAARIWKRWRGFRAAAAAVCGSDAGSITSCSCCAHASCTRLLRLQQQPSHAALSHGAHLQAMVKPITKTMSGTECDRLGGFLNFFQARLPIVLFLYYDLV